MTDNRPRDSVAVMISSCDKFKDVWTPFFTLFFKYWADCPYPVYLITEKEKFEDRRVQSLCLGEGRDFSSLLDEALTVINEPLILLMLEDFFLDADVDTKQLNQYVAYFKQVSAGYMRLVANPAPDRCCDDNGRLGIINKGADYRLSLQVAIWDKRVLLGLLRSGESPWELELLGSRRSDELEQPFLCVNSSQDEPFRYRHVIVRGKWCAEAVDFCKYEQVPLDLDTRAIESPWALFIRSAQARRLFAPLLALFPFLQGKNRYRIKKRVAAVFPGFFSPK